MNRAGTKQALLNDIRKDPKKYLHQSEHQAGKVELAASNGSAGSIRGHSCWMAAAPRWPCCAPASGAETRRKLATICRTREGGAWRVRGQFRSPAREPGVGRRAGRGRHGPQEAQTDWQVIFRSWPWRWWLAAAQRWCPTIGTARRYDAMRTCGDLQPLTKANRVTDDAVRVSALPCCRSSADRLPDGVRPVEETLGGSSGRLV
jgi:hypothetical protein